MKILVSACLLGENVKYNGQNNFSEKVAKYIEGHEVISVCPEMLGGLSCPRESCEIVNGVVQTKEGRSCDAEFNKGARLALELALKEKIDLAILQSRSPSCGAKQIYDGTFSGGKISGMGIFAALLVKNGIKIIDVEDI